MFKKIFKTFICIFLLCYVYGFSDIKQKDEYSCAPVCAANCIIEILNEKLPVNELVKELSISAKTNSYGTTAQNLIKAIEDSLLKRHLQAEIKYYGIRKTNSKYYAKKALDICTELHNGRFVILNLGVYKKEKNIYKREYGHYVNAYACKEGKILISDPYTQKHGNFYIELQKTNSLKIANTKDNEKYIFNNFVYYEINPLFEYQKENEKVFLNGIISIYPYYL